MKSADTLLVAVSFLTDNVATTSNGTTASRGPLTKHDSGVHSSGKKHKHFIKQSISRPADALLLTLQLAICALSDTPTDGKSLHHFAATISTTEFGALLKLREVTPLAVSFMSRTARIVSSVVVAVHPHADHQLDDATAFELVKPVIIRGKGWRFTMKG
ncbi:hypothetical protein EVAR_16490_1 [Eumeta japonica]|uniref:Uncharacterized protein n=1 Tax=Eumeta variegata TaxID=151549 RepID=A0A4C1UKD9_EUMVA|nr:hypothetical protein EVAR_16490_1 [Eumeta japonica]